MTIKSSLLSVRGKAAPVNLTIYHLNGQLLPICHPMNIRLLVSKTLVNLRALMFSSMKMVAQQFRAFAMKIWESFKLHVNVGSLLSFQEQSWSPKWKKSTHSSHENVASLGTADGTASRRDNTEQDEADPTGSAEIGEATGSAEIGGEARAQADAAGPAHGATTAMPQVSNSLIPQPAKHLSAAAAVKKSTTLHAEGSYID